MNSLFSVENSVFEDNFSVGRGSILFSQQLTSNSVFRNSSFENNYAMLGGVFFSSAQGSIEAYGCVFTNNFGFQGGVLYQESEGQALFVDSNFTGNEAIQAGIVYSINS